MTQLTIAIAGESDDFCAVLAEHAQRELGVKILRAPSAEKAKILNAELVISQSQFENQKPLNLKDVLKSIQLKLIREELSLGEALFSAQQKTLVHGKKTVALTDKESQLLLALIKNKHGVEKEALLKDVWGVTSELESHTLETHVYRLRAKLKEAGVAAQIIAEPGKYVLEI